MVYASGEDARQAELRSRLVVAAAAVAAVIVAADGFAADWALADVEWRWGQLIARRKREAGPPPAKGMQKGAEAPDPVAAALHLDATGGPRSVGKAMRKGRP